MASELELFCGRVVHYMSKSSKKKKYLVVTNICFKLYESDNAKKFLTAKYTRVPLKLLSSVEVAEVKAGFGLQLSCDKQGVQFTVALDSAELQSSLRATLVGAAKKEGGCIHTAIAASSTSQADREATRLSLLGEGAESKSQADIDQELLRLARQMQGGTRMNMRTIAIRPTRERGETTPVLPSVSSTVSGPMVLAPHENASLTSTAASSAPQHPSFMHRPSGVLQVTVQGSSSDALEPVQPTAAEESGGAPAAEKEKEREQLRFEPTPPPTSQPSANPPAAGTKPSIKLSLIEKRNMFLRSISTPFQKQPPNSPPGPKSASKLNEEATSPPEEEAVVQSTPSSTLPMGDTIARPPPGSRLSTNLPMTSATTTTTPSPRTAVEPPVRPARPVREGMPGPPQPGSVGGAATLRRKRGATSLAVPTFKPLAPLPPLPPTPGGPTMDPADPTAEKENVHEEEFASEPMGPVVEEEFSGDPFTPPALGPPTASIGELPAIPAHSMGAEHEDGTVIAVPRVLRSPRSVAPPPLLAPSDGVEWLPQHLSPAPAPLPPGVDPASQAASMPMPRKRSTTSPLGMAPPLVRPAAPSPLRSVASPLSAAVVVDFDDSTH